MRKSLGNSTDRRKEKGFFVLVWSCSTYPGGLYRFHCFVESSAKKLKLIKVEVIEIFLSSYLFKDLIVFCNTFQLIPKHVQREVKCWIKKQSEVRAARHGQSVCCDLKGVNNATYSMAIFMRGTVVLCCFKRASVMVPSSAEIAILVVSWWSSAGIFARGEN